jgi:hypothetical protein
MFQHGFWFQLTEEERSQAKVSRGPSNPQQLNRFAYVLNNPSKNTDPTGHCVPFCAFALPEVAVGVVVIAGALIIGEYYGWGPNAAQNDAALAASINAGVNQLANDANGITAALADSSALPKTGKHPYVPPKQKGSTDPVRKKGGGFVDKYGNTWEWAKDQHGGPHWDVQHPNGSHTNVAPDGTIIGPDNFPNK